VEYTHVAMEDRRLHWKGIMVTALISGAVAVGTGYILFRVQTHQPRLQYTVSESLPFETSSESHAIYHSTIENAGQTEIRNVVALFTFGSATIVQRRVSAPPSLTVLDTVGRNVYRLTSPSLNPGEKIGVSVLTQGVGKLPAAPIASVRGDGVTGELAERHQNIPLMQDDLFQLLVPVVLVAIMLQLVLTRYRSTSQHEKAADKDDEKHHDDQRFVMAYMLRLHDFDDEADHILATGETSYWVQGDRLAALALRSTDDEYRARAERVLLGLLEYAHVHPVSQGIIHYNLARIAKSRGNDNSAAAELRAAEQLIPKLLAKRLKLDATFSGLSG